MRLKGEPPYAELLLKDSQAVSTLSSMASRQPPSQYDLWLKALVGTHFFRSSGYPPDIRVDVPVRAISFLSLHASFPSFFDLVERKQWSLNYAATG